uniref:C2H2-type domain-containing protein n=1 Tax=Angiostrongylus cantonensis TaxID=6313 RepID=A0A158PA41_ANGCA
LDPSTGFTCVTCQLIFETPELQRDHYKTDWHRYNLKRQALQKEEDELSSLYCFTCRKKMKSRNALKDHLASKKHKEMETKGPKGPRQPRKKNSEQLVQSHERIADIEIQSIETSDPDDDDDDSSSSWVTAIPITSCLFCPQAKSNKEEIAEHMKFHHGFSLPDKKRLVDEDGMLNYLGLKVGAGHCCIYCPDIRSRFATTAACQAHMRDKQHCKINREPEGMLEFAEYYDYSPMCDSDYESGVSDSFIDDGWSLTLPSGAKIGHRLLMMYYRQYLRPKDSNKPDVGRTALEKARGLYPALAWTSTTGTIAKQAARDIKFMERYRRRFDLRVGLKSNKLFKSQGRNGDN